MDGARRYTRCTCEDGKPLYRGVLASPGSRLSCRRRQCKFHIRKKRQAVLIGRNTDVTHELGLHARRHAISYTAGLGRGPFSDKADIDLTTMRHAVVA